MNMPLAPELQVSEWINTLRPLSLASLRGRVVAIHAFQMLCPGCVAHGLPQAQRLRAAFADAPLTLIGLHSVFEHHAVMTPDALRAFAYEYRLDFPIAIDQPAPDSPLPLTMQAYGLRGTPSLLLIDAQGRLRLNHFGQLDDLRLGGLVGQLLAASDSDSPANASAYAQAPGCDGEACAIPSQAKS